MRIWRLPCVLLISAAIGCSGPVPMPVAVQFPTDDGGVVHANLYGEGNRGVVLAHGGRFDRLSWETQARTLAAAGYLTLAIDFRGRGQSEAGPESKPDDVYNDVLAAVRYLRERRARTVTVIGASFGGWASARAATEARPGEIDGIVLLAASPIDAPERMQGRKLFITTRADANGRGTLRLPGIRDQYERASGPKQLVILAGDAHAQYIFDTDQAARLMDELLTFLARVNGVKRASGPR